jgi:hypothetical protein
MLPLYEDPHFTFCFADDRIIPRFHLEGVEVGRRVEVFKIDAGTGERLGLLATATVGEDGWVDLSEPIIVRAGEVSWPCRNRLRIGNGRRLSVPGVHLSDRLEPSAATIDAALHEDMLPPLTQMRVHPCGQLASTFDLPGLHFQSLYIQYLKIQLLHVIAEEADHAARKAVRPGPPGAAFRRRSE